MNTVYFRYAVEIEKTRSITQAAENLFMAQPNLSRAIKELEDSLGIVIFERKSNGVVPTRDGVKFLSHAKVILDQLDKMEKINLPQNSDRQCLTVSMPRSSYIAKAVTKFTSGLDEKKEILMNIQETSSMKAINSIIENRFNLGIIRYQSIHEGYFKEYLEDKNLSYDVVWEFNYVAVMSKNHPLAYSEKIKYQDFSEFTEILHGDSSVPYLNNSEPDTDGMQDAKMKKIYVYERCSQFDILSQIPSTFMWVSPIPDEYLDRYDLVQRNCSVADNHFKDVLIYKKGYKFSEYDRKFIDCVYECKNEVAYKEYV